MTHQEIEQKETIERYVRSQLLPEERREFEEHYFTCDQCFEQVRSTERLIAGVRFAAEKGLLKTGEGALTQFKTSPSWTGWLRPALAVAMVTALALGGALLWLVLYRMPELGGKLARERQERERIAAAYQVSLNHAEEQLRRGQQELARIESRLEQLASAAYPEANIPLVMLDATRRAEANAHETTVPASAKSLLLWIEIDPGARHDEFRMQVHTTQNQLVQTIEGLKRNSYGALVAGFSAASFKTENYLVRLYGVNRLQNTLVGEYSLRIRKR